MVWCKPVYTLDFQQHKPMEYVSLNFFQFHFGPWDIENLSPLTVEASHGEQLFILNHLMCLINDFLDKPRKPLEF